MVLCTSVIINIEIVSAPYILNRLYVFTKLGTNVDHD